MKRRALLILLLATTVHAEPPNAPMPSKETTLDHHIRLGLIAGEGLARAADWASTEQCLREPYAVCHEVELPNFLVQSKAGFALFGAAMTYGEDFLSKRLARKHPKMAIVGDALSFTATSLTAAHNYWLVGKKPQGR